MLQTMIQGNVHGAMGGVVGAFWESTATSSVDPEGIIQDVSDSLAAAEDSVQSALDATVESISEDMDATIESAIDLL
jgi:hypothetical protein